MVNLYNICATYRNFSVYELEKLYSSNLEERYNKILDLTGVKECVILQTCNRVEYYIITKNIRSVLDYLSQIWGQPLNLKKFAVKNEDDVLKHLFSVTAGIDSLVIGEDQIMGQVRDAINKANIYHSCSSLTKIFNKALKAGAKIRKLTKINKNSFSIGSEAVKFALHLLGENKQKCILVIGAGKIGTLVAKALKNAPFDAIFVANRTYQRAQRLAQKYSFQVRKWSKINQVLKTVNIIIVATAAPHPVLNYGNINEIMKKRNGTPLKIIDISMPQNVDDKVSQIQNVEIYTLDALKKYRETYEQDKLDEIQKAKLLIEEEIIHFKKELSCLYIEPVISHLYKKLNSIREQELKRIYDHLKNLSSNQKQMIEKFSMSMLKRFLHNISSNIRDLVITKDLNAVQILSSIFTG